MPSALVNRYLSSLKTNAQKARRYLSGSISRYWLGYPSTVFIAINSACNLSCKMCDVGTNNESSQFYEIMRPGKDSQLDMASLKKLIDEIALFRPLIAVTSAEPLLYKDIVEFTGYVKSKNLQLQITTNGFVLPEYALPLANAGLDILWVSLDGPPSIHNHIRGNAQSFERALSGINKLLDFKRMNHLTRPTISVNYAISCHNHAHLDGFLNHLNNNLTGQIENVTFSHMNYVTEEMARKHNELFRDFCKATSSSIGQADPMKVDAGTLFKQILTARSLDLKNIAHVSFGPDLRTEKQIEDFYHHPEKIVGRSACIAPWSVAQLTANGDWVVITRCFYKTFGNIRKESFLKTWRGKEYESFRRFIRKARLTPACTRCCAVL